MADEYFKYTACKFLQKQLKKLINQLRCAVTSDDIECIHKCRVASRRIRAGLKFFDPALPQKKQKNWNSHIRKITKKLGTARDKDVQIDFVSNYLNELDDDDYKPGIELLILRLKQKRQKVQQKIIYNVDKFVASDVLDEMVEYTEKTLSRYNQKAVPEDKSFFLEHAKKEIESKVEKLMSISDSLNDSHNKKGHHEMRIAAKKLRYTLELCDQTYDNKLGKIIKSLKKTQTYLGDIHDMDVWQDFITDFIAKEKRKAIEHSGNSKEFEPLEKGLIHMHEYCARRRDSLFEEFVVYWNETGQKKIRKKLRSIIS